ncbi:MAG: outer membrane protein assembly factor BamD [Holosporales bacterium]|nr:outer membrane protein assembly factor BamD [Holosporales bacterium]
MNVCVVMKNVLLLATAILLAGCAKDIDLEVMKKQSAETIFASGQKEMKAGNHNVAVKIFEELERLHPYSRLNADAQLNAGQCHYTKKRYDEAAAAFAVFVKTYPTNEKVPYALYMLGKLYYEQMPIVSRDQEQTVLALDYFNELCERYPDSKYVEDARRKIAELRQHVAGREVYVAMFYQAHNNYAAAIGRLNTVVELYRDTEHAPEALHRLVECYVAMGAREEAVKVNKLLQSRHPETSWAGHSRSLLGMKILGSRQQQNNSAKSKAKPKKATTR